MRTEISKRKYDKMFTLWGWMVDPNIELDDENPNQYFPMRWIALGVFPTFNQARQLQNKVR